MENLFFLALVAIVGLIRWFVQASEAKRNAQSAKRAEPRANTPLPRAPAESEEERMRRFMEALGVPAGSAPAPRKITPRRETKIQPIDPFPLPRGNVIRVPAPTVAAETLPTATEPAPLPPPAVELVPPVKTATVAPAAEFAVRNLAREAVTIAASVDDPGTRPSTGIAARLATPEGLRDAIILREIFGPPRSMQPADLTRIL